jgi:sterol desaturase/sphingolipid hydroxylase (fatty acid hydroxylase superfamily)
MTQSIAIVSVLAFFIAWEALYPYFGFFKGDIRNRIRHDGFNLAIGVVNAALVAVGFAWAWSAAAGWSAERGIGLLNALDIPGGWRLVLAFLLLDAWMYAWHRLNHTLPFFWRFHKFHHGDTEMDVTTASRFHFAEIGFSSVLRIPVIALTGVSLSELVLYETVMFAVVQFHHADIGIPARVDRWLSLLIVTPDLHKVHHSAWQPETDSNYGSLFSFWDRWFGTRRLHPDPKRIRFGVDEVTPGPSGASAPTRVPRDETGV